MKAQEIDRQLVRAQLKLFHSIRSKMKPPSSIKNLTLVQLTTLLFLKEHNNSPISEISNHFGIATPTATVLVDRLSSLKLVQRTSDKNDRRITRVVLTKKGGVLLQKAMKEREAMMRKMLSRLTIKDKSDFLRIMRNLTQN